MWLKNVLLTLGDKVASVSVFVRKEFALAPLYFLLFFLQSFFFEPPFPPPTAPAATRILHCTTVTGTISHTGPDTRLYYAPVSGCINLGDFDRTCDQHGKFLKLHSSSNLMVLWSSPQVEGELHELPPDKENFSPILHPVAGLSIEIAVTYCVE